MVARVSAGKDSHATKVFVTLLVLIATPFAIYAVGLGVLGLLGELPERSRFARPISPVTVSFFFHTIVGAVVMLLAPLQLLSFIRNRWPGFHRWAGRVGVTTAFLAGVGGLSYILFIGTVGGRTMDLGFGLYGVLIILASVQTYRFARARDFTRHREWALRLFILAIGSLLYRVQYGVWGFVTDGLGVSRYGEVPYAGWFDQFQMVGFYLPYLVGLEIWFRWGQGSATSTPANEAPAAS